MGELTPWPFLIAVVGGAVVLWGRRLGRYQDAVLLALAAAALVGYVGPGGNPLTAAVKAHDVAHYYLGSKYASELSYSRLYECVVVADLQDGRVRRGDGRRITDLRTNVRVSADDVLADPARCTGHFSSERWQSFREDVRYFARVMGPEQWQYLTIDYGYNATPVWTTLGTLVTNTGPASDSQIGLLGLLDPLFLIAMLLAIGWAFGRRTLAVSVIVLTTYLPAEFYWTGRSFLRWDWLFYLVLAVCLLKTDRPLLAGAAIGYAAMLRVFPGIALLAPALLLVHPRLHRPNRAWPRFYLGAAAAVVVLGAVSLVAVGGIDTYRAFAVNLIKTAHTPFPSAIGLPSVLSWRPGEGITDLWDPAATEPLAAWLQARYAAADGMIGPHLLIVAGFVLLYVLAARRATPWVAVALATTLLVVVADMFSYYYMFILATALLQHDSRRDAAWLLGACAATQLIGLAPIPGMPTSIDHQYALITTITIITVAAILIHRRNAPATDDQDNAGQPHLDTLARPDHGTRHPTR